MAEEDTGPICLADQPPPTAEAQGECVVLTLPLVAVGFPQGVREIQVAMTAEDAKHIELQLRRAGDQAIKNRSS
ncbi:MAG: hypothetical protein ABSB77_22215 [Xanthobacteraceae bacterium]|jgi:hypothetical protein